MADFTLGRSVIDQIEGWAHQLAAPLLPLREVPEGDVEIRLEFQEHIPHAVMVGKCIRAVSGIRAAHVLAEVGYVAECAALLRIVSDFCTEITAVGKALNRGGALPSAVQEFVDQYFVPRPRTPAELAAAKRNRYVSREQLMKAELRLAERAQVDGEELRVVHRFLNMTYDAYVHGAYETTMELYDPHISRFMMSGHVSTLKRSEFVEAVYLKLHEVVVALEVTAAVTANATVFDSAKARDGCVRALEISLTQLEWIASA